jgi:hypothetical protein
MKLTELASDGSGVLLRELATDRALAREVQTRLSELGLLDRPVDGDFGPVSKFVLREFARRVGVALDEMVNRRLAQALLDSRADDLFPLKLDTDFASRVIKYMRLESNNYWLARAPGFLNIVYVEGADDDGSPNGDTFNQFNDRRLVIAFEQGRPRLLLNALATTEPGRFYTEHPLNPGGAARIAFGQYKAWRVGTHMAGRPSAHKALVQVADIKVHRDLNKDGKRTGDLIDLGSGFGVNQHSGHNADPDNIGRYSAGCLVGRSHAEHKEFMRLVKTDPRFQASNGYIYITTVIAGDDLERQVG